MNTTCTTAPCADCPFRRTVEPGTLGGSPVSTFIGQVNGPFWLPCHSHTDYTDLNWKTDYSKPQCCGAAMFRSAIGWKGSPVLALKEHDPAIIFSNFTEFVAHHSEISQTIAAGILQATTPAVLTRVQLGRLNNKYITR